jgi:hypothetical protein
VRSAAAWAGLLLLASCGRTEPPQAPSAPRTQAAPVQDVEALRRQASKLARDVAALDGQIADARRDHESLRTERDAIAARRRAALAEIASLQEAVAGLSPEPVRGNVLAVDADSGVLMMDRGAVDGVRPGDRYDVVRPSDGTFIGRAEVESLAGPAGSTAKLRVIEGHAYNIVPGDLIGELSLPSTSPPPEYKVTTVVTGACMLDRGPRDGLRLGDRLSRDGLELRVDRLEESYAIANIVRGTAARGDVVRLVR